MGLTGKANLDAANTAFETAVNAVLGGQASQIASQFTNFHPAEGTSVEVLVVDGLPMFREWLGAKQFNDLRTYHRNYPIRQWEASFRLPRVQVDGDKSGVVGQRIGDFAARQGAMIEKLIIDELLTNPTGYDGVSLLNDSHPNTATGATTDNLTTNAVSFAELASGIQAIEEMADEGGNFLGLVATHLVVGTAQKQAGMVLTGSDRPVAMNTAGAFYATSGVQSSVVLQNYTGGSLQLLVSPYITGNQWFVMALGQPGVRPFACAEFRRATAYAQTDMGDPARFNSDEYVWSIEADLTPYPAAWQAIYGSVTA